MNLQVLYNSRLYSSLSATEITLTCSQTCLSELLIFNTEILLTIVEVTTTSYHIITYDLLGRILLRKSYLRWRHLKQIVQQTCKNIDILWDFLPHYFLDDKHEYQHIHVFSNLLLKYICNHIVLNQSRQNIFNICFTEFKNTFEYCLLSKLMKYTPNL